MSTPISIDDTNTTLIQYKGKWEALNGSTRQWDGTVHTTGQAGTTATFQFRGYLLWVWGTVPGGVGNNSVQLTIDGGVANITSHTSNGTAEFNVIYFETPLLTETFHTAVVTNLGSTANGSTEFQLDRFEFQTTDVIPLFAPPAESTTSTSPTTTNTSSASSHSPIKAIVGGVIGALFFVTAFLAYILWRKIKRSASRETSVPTPFPMNLQTDMSRPHSTEDLATNSNSQLRQPNTLMSPSEKPGYQNFGLESARNSPSNSHWTVHPSSISRPTTMAFTTLNLNTSDLMPARRIELTSIDESLSIHRHPFNESPIIQSPLSSSTDMYDNPPPAYRNNEHGLQATP